MTRCLFVSDLHGNIDKYRKLFEAIIHLKPVGVFLGGDLLPHGFGIDDHIRSCHESFVSDFLAGELSNIRDQSPESYPQLFIVLGNDDPRVEEPAVMEVASRKLWHYIHMNKVTFNGFDIYGYAHTPPSPFLLKDWERYDVSRYVDPGCIAPPEGQLTVPVDAGELKYGTIANDLKMLTGESDLSKAVFLFHAPPHGTNLDRAALDGKMIDHVPLDVHVGSIAIQLFIQKRQPHLTLHGHIHESSRLTGSWQDEIGATQCFSAAHDGPELAVIQFYLENPENAERILL